MLNTFRVIRVRAGSIKRDRHTGQLSLDPDGAPAVGLARRAVWRYQSLPVVQEVKPSLQDVVARIELKSEKRHNMSIVCVGRKGSFFVLFASIFVVSQTRF